MAGFDFWPDPVADDVPRWAEEQFRRLGGVLQATTVKWIGVTYAANWADVGGNYQVVEYCRDGFGFVRLRGQTKRINSNMSGTTLVFTLPAGFRPAAYEIFHLDTNNAQKDARVEVRSDGTVYAIAPNLQINNEISFSQITFYSGVKGE